MFLFDFVVALFPDICVSLSRCESLDEGVWI